MSEAHCSGESAAVGHDGSRGRPFVEALALLAFVLVFARGREHAVDLHLWDELVSYWTGHDLVRGLAFPDLAWSPLHALVYGVLSLAPIAAPAPDAMASLVLASAVLSAYWFLRALAPPWLAMGLAIAFASSPIVSQQDRVGQPGLPTVYVFALAFAFVGAGLQARGRTATAATALLLAAFTRSEWIPWFAGYAGLAVFLPPLRSRPRLRAALAIGAMAAALLLVLSPAHRSRSWLAFCQHYAQRACLRDMGLEWERALGDIEPERVRLAPFELQRAFDEPGPWIERELPGASSLGSALLAAPDAVLAHVEHNVLELPTSVLAAASSGFVDADTNRSVLALAVVLGATGLLLRRRREPPVPRTDEIRLWPVFAATSLLALAGPLVVAARSELCLPVLVPLLGSAASGLSGLLPSRARTASTTASWVAVVLAVAMVAAAAATWVPLPFASSRPPLRHRDEVAMLQSELPTGPVVLLSWWWDQPLRLLAREDVERRSLWGVATRPFGELLAEWNATAVLVTPELEFELQRFPDAKAVLAAPPWRLAAERGEVRLYVR